MKVNQNNLRKCSGYVDISFEIVIFAIVVVFMIMIMMGLVATTATQKQERIHACKMEYLKSDRPVEDILKICSE